MTISLSGLAKRLVTDGLLSEAQADESLRLARRDKIPFVTHLVKNKVAEGHRIALAASQEFGAPLLDLNAFDLANCPRDLVDPKLLRKHRILPLFKRANRLFLAASDPTNIAAFDELKFHTGLYTDIILVDENQLSPAIDQLIDMIEGNDSLRSLLEDADLDGLNMEVNPGGGADH